MSIATLKKKAAHRYNRLSVGQQHFSLNGTHRSQGYVGQTMLSRSLPRTLMTGNVVRGHGGLGGEYHRGAIVREGTGLGAATMLNDPKVVKASVLDTNGMMMTKYRWIRRPAPVTSVKPDTTLNVHTQQQYLDIKRRVVLSEQCHKEPSVPVPKNCVCSVGGVGGTVDIMRPSYTHLGWKSRKHVVTKEPVVKTQGDYLMRLDKACAELDSGVALREVTEKKGKALAPFACGRGYYTPIQQMKMSGVGTSTVVYIP